MPSNLWNRNYGLLLIITFCSGLTAQLLNTALPLYLVNALGTTTTISGVLSGLYTIVSCVARPFCGHLVDRMGRRPFIILGMSVFALGCFGFGLVTVAAMLVFFRLMQGLGFGISATASSTAASDNIPAARRLPVCIGWSPCHFNQRGPRNAGICPAGKQRKTVHLAFPL